MSIFDKIEDMRTSLSELVDRLRTTAMARIGAYKADNATRVAGQTVAQVRTQRDQAIKNIHSADLKNNPHGVTAAQVGMPTKAQVDAQINNLIPATVLPFSNFGTQDYLPIGVAGSFEGASTLPNYHAMGLLLEADGTLVTLRNGTNGSKMGVYYGYLPNAELGTFRAPSRTNKPYHPSYFPPNTRARHLTHTSEYLIMGLLETIDTGEAYGYFISLANGTFDDRLHVGTVIESTVYNSLFSFIRNQTVSLIIGDEMYFVSPLDEGRNGRYGVYLNKCLVNDLVSNTLSSIERITGITTDGIVGVTADSDSIVFASKISSEDPADNPLALVSGYFSSFNLQHSGQYTVYAYANGEGQLRINLAHNGYWSTGYTSASRATCVSAVYDLAEKTAVMDPGHGGPLQVSASEDLRTITFVENGFFSGTARNNLGMYVPQNSATVQFMMTSGGTLFGFSVRTNMDLVSFSRTRHFDYSSRFDFIRRVNTDRRSTHNSVADDPIFPSAFGSVIAGAIYLGDDQLLIHSRGRRESGATDEGLVVTRLEGGPEAHHYKSAFNDGVIRTGYSPSSQRDFLTDLGIDEKDWYFPICEVIGEQTHLSGWCFAGSVLTPHRRRQSLHSDLSQSGPWLEASDEVIRTACLQIARSQLPETNTALGILVIPQASGVPPFLWIHSLETATRTSHLILSEVELTMSGEVITNIQPARIYPPRQLATTTTGINWSSTSYHGSRGSWAFYDTPEAVLIGGPLPVLRNYVGSSARNLMSFKWSKVDNEFVWDSLILQSGNQLPSYDWTHFVHPDLGFCQASAGLGVGAAVSDHFTKCLMAPIAKTEVEFDAYARPPQSEWVVLAAQDVAEGYSVYFTDPVPLFMIGSSYVLEPTDFDLRDIKTNPADTTFYVYVTLENDQPKYLIRTTEIPETFTTMFIGTIITNQTQIESINIDKVYRVDTMRISTQPIGSAIPATAGHPADEERLTWT